MPIPAGSETSGLSLRWAIPNTTVTIYRGTTIDEYSGDISNETVLASAISASIIEQSRIVDDPNSGTPRVVRLITGRVPDGTDVKNTDRLLDETNSRSYWIRSVRQHENPIYTSDVTLDLVRVDKNDP